MTETTPKIFARKYKLLILFIGMVFLFAPFFESKPIVVQSFIGVIILFWEVVLKLSKKVIVFSAAVGLVSLLIEIYFPEHTALSLENKIPIGINMSCAILFYSTAIKYILDKIFSEKVITPDTIWGGVSIYFLIGIFYAHIYRLIWLFNPGAFSVPTGMNTYAAAYFSFATLTTLGYGDITPTSSFAGSVAVLEAAIGQIFLAVFVARLVALQLHREAVPEGK